MRWLALIPAILAFLARLVPGPRIVDDAYITFRYAQNLVDGLGLVYNSGEQVLGTTTPLYTLLLASTSGLAGTSDYAHMAWILNALLDTIGVAILYWLAWEITSSWLVALGTAALWAIAPFSVTFAIGGLETSLVITLLIATFALILAKQNNWAGLCLALATLTRPDILIAVAAILMVELIKALWQYRVRSSARRSNENLTRLEDRPLSASIMPSLIYLGTLFPWVLYASLRYGSPLPNSLAAKSVAYHLPPLSALIRLLQHLATPFHEHLLFGGRWVLIGLILYGSLYLIGAWYAYQKNRQSLYLFLYPVFYVSAYAIMNPLIFRWYLSPPIPFLFLGIVLGLDAVLHEIANVASQRIRKRVLNISLGLAIALALGSLVNAWSPCIDPGNERCRPAPEMAWIELEKLYHEIALDIRPELERDGGRLAAGDIGVLGWYTSAPILDLVGLISPQVSDYYPLPDDSYVINYAVSTEAVLFEKPLFIVILEVYGRNTLLQNDRFLAQYGLWKSYPTDIYGSRSMLVYHRLD